jgi:hypothetical protein
MFCELVYNKQALSKVGGLAFSWTLGTHTAITITLRAFTRTLLAFTSMLTDFTSTPTAFASTFKAITSMLTGFTCTLPTFTSSHSLFFELYVPRLLSALFSLLENKITLTVNL